jgi:hypothetical protein
VLAGVGLGHQSLHVAPNELARGIAEQPLGRAINRADRAPPVDRDDAIDGGINDRAIERVGETWTICSPRGRRCRVQIKDPSPVSSVEVRVGCHPSNFSSLKYHGAALRRNPLAEKHYRSHSCLR